MRIILNLRGAVRQALANATPVEEPDAMAKISDDAFDRHYLALTFEVGCFMLEHLRNVYREFDGDIVMCMVLGEVGQHNAAHFMREILPRSGKDAKELATDAVIDASIRRCNALSIAEASGIPRETVRRKLAKLERLGWISRDAGGGVRVTRMVGRHFRGFDRRTMNDLLDLTERLRATLATR